MSPQSYGSVSLTSANPMAPPSINPAYLSDEQDLEAMVAVSDVYSSLIGTSFGRSLCALQLLPGPLFGWGKSREGVRSWLKALACPYFHHVSTCRMAPRGADEEAGVVDSSLRVIGVVGLRVADASVAPRIPCAPTQAMSYMIGHRAAEIILTAYNSM
jgi:choline dehydrogenase